MILPMVWATAAPLPEVIDWCEVPEVGEHKPVVRGMAFYRRYTEAILRRYVCMSMEAGRAPSLLGREMFRGKVTSYRVHSFEDVVIFVHDVEKCLAKLDIEQREIVERVALQEFTLREAATTDGPGTQHCRAAICPRGGLADQELARCPTSRSHEMLSRGRGGGK